jgi:hypothetical protein
MSEPRCLTTLWAYRACYRDSFTSFYLHYNSSVNSKVSRRIRHKLHGLHLFVNLGSEFLEFLSHTLTNVDYFMLCNQNISHTPFPNKYILWFTVIAMESEITDVSYCLNWTIRKYTFLSLCQNARCSRLTATSSNLHTMWHAQNNEI